jgi:hypothetical protein
MNRKTKAGLIVATILFATLLSGCAASTANRVNGDDWRWGFSYAGPNYPDTGH